MHLKNHSNEYIEALERGVFDDIPKSVFAAIAVSYLVNHGIEFKDVTQEILNEWQALYDNKIVPQKPKSRPTKRAADGEGVSFTTRESTHDETLLADPQLVLRT